jgi:hypothetical protein
MAPTRLFHLKKFRHGPCRTFRIIEIQLDQGMRRMQCREFSNVPHMTTIPIPQVLILSTNCFAQARKAAPNQAISHEMKFSSAFNPIIDWTKVENKSCIWMLLVDFIQQLNLRKETIIGGLNDVQLKHGSMIATTTIADGANALTCRQLHSRATLLVVGLETGTNSKFKKRTASSLGHSHIQYW